MYVKQKSPAQHAHSNSLKQNSGSYYFDWYEFFFSGNWDSLHMWSSIYGRDVQPIQDSADQWKTALAQNYNQTTTKEW